MDWKNLGWPKATFSGVIPSSLFLWFFDSFSNSKRRRKTSKTGKYTAMIQEKKKKKIKERG